MNRIRISHRLFIAVAATISAVSALADNAIGHNNTNPGGAAETVVSNALPASEYPAGQGG